jgi:hypothetical protein
MSRDDKQIKGDKLRNAILIVWLASKYDKNLSAAKLRRIIGYDSSGLYSASESGWFKQEKDKIVLTDKANSYLHETLLKPHSNIRTLLIYFAFVPAINFLDWYLLTSFNINMSYHPLVSIAFFILFLLIALNWYRLVWWTFKRKGNP